MLENRILCIELLGMNKADQSALVFLSKPGMHNTSLYALGCISIDLIYSANCLLSAQLLCAPGGDVYVGVQEESRREVT